MEYSATDCGKRPKPDNMLRRLWKKVKGAPLSCDEETTASPSTSATQASRRRKGKHNIRPTEGHDADDDHSSSSDVDDSSSSSSEGYYSLEDMITVPTKRQSHLTATTITTPSPSKAMQVDLKFLARTQFPDFDLESLPDGELTETSDDDSVIQRKEERYRTKEDQDVAVFMDIAKRLNIKSLLHLLQGHVRSQNLPAAYMREYNQALAKECQGGEIPSLDSAIKNSLEKKPLAKQKKFRWAEVNDGKVRTIIHEIESIKECSTLWWLPEEMHAIRAELIEVVQFFRKRKPEYIAAVETVAKHVQDRVVIEENMKRLTEISFPRGLETHIVRYLSDHRRSTIKAILEEQKECRTCGDCAETTMHCLREQSLAYSRMSTKFAASMAKCDEIDALKASMSRWGTSSPVQSATI